MKEEMKKEILEGAKALEELTKKVGSPQLAQAMMSFEAMAKTGTVDDVVWYISSCLVNLCLVLESMKHYKEGKDSNEFIDDFGKLVKGLLVKAHHTMGKEGKNVKNENIDPKGSSESSKEAWR